MIEGSCDYVSENSSLYGLAKLGGVRYYVSGEILLLVCHVILRNHVAIGSCDFTGRSLSNKLLPSQI